MRGRVVSEIIITTMTNSDMLLDTSLLDRARTDLSCSLLKSVLSYPLCSLFHCKCKFTWI